MALSTEEILEIHGLYARYNHAIDNGRHEEFAATFTEDGSLDSGLAGGSGREGLAEFSRGVEQMVPGIRHLAMNIVVDGDGDSATGTAYVLVHVPGESGRTIMFTGIYEDELQRVDGEWLFAKRVANPDD